MDQGRGASQPVKLAATLKVLLNRRMLIGIYIGQYCVNVLTYFFLTWFPVYLVEQRGMSILRAGVVIVLPAICGFAGGVLGGIMSDALLRRGVSLSLARKIPIVAGMLLSISMILCNFVEANWIVVLIMSLALFGKGVGSLGWAVVADTAPKEMTGLYGGLFNTFGNMGAITTPIVIGYIVAVTGSFAGALVYVGANALLAVLGYTVIAGRFERVQLTESVATSGSHRGWRPALERVEARHCRPIRAVTWLDAQGDRDGSRAGRRTRQHAAQFEWRPRPLLYT